MVFILKNNWLRTIIAVILFMIGIFTIVLLMATFDGQFDRTAVYILVICITLSIASRNLLDLYSRFEGNVEKYSLVPFLTKQNTCLCDVHTGNKFQFKNVDGSGVIAKDIKGDVVVSFNAGYFHKSSAFSFRVRQLSEYIRLWLHHYKKGTEDVGRPIKGKLPGQINLAYTNRVCLLHNGLFELCQVDAMSTIVDQRIIGRELVLDDVVVSSTTNLMQKDRDLNILTSPQTDCRMQGLYMLMLFLDKDGQVIANDDIPRYFLSYFQTKSSRRVLSGKQEGLNQFSKNQAQIHSPYPINSFSLLGLGLILRDSGAPVVVCTVTLDHKASSSIPFHEWLDSKSSDETEALLRYWVRKSIKRGD